MSDTENSVMPEIVSTSEPIVETTNTRETQSTTSMDAINDNSAQSSVAEPEGTHYVSENDSDGDKPSIDDIAAQDEVVDDAVVEAVVEAIVAEMTASNNIAQDSVEKPVIEETVEETVEEETMTEDSGNSSSSSEVITNTNLIIVLGYDTVTGQVSEVPISTETLINIFNQAFTHVQMCQCTESANNSSEEESEIDSSEEESENEYNESEEEEVVEEEKEIQVNKRVDTPDQFIPCMLLFGSVLVLMLNVLQMWCRAKYTKCY